MNINDIQTPFFVLGRKVMVDEVQKLNYAIATYWPNTIPAYSVKTNSLPYLAKMLNELGVYAEVVSQDEYEMVGLDTAHSASLCFSIYKSVLQYSQVES